MVKTGESLSFKCPCINDIKAVYNTSKDQPELVKALISVYSKLDNTGLEYGEKEALADVQKIMVTTLDELDLITHYGYLVDIGGVAFSEEKGLKQVFIRGSGTGVGFNIYDTDLFNDHRDAQGLWIYEVKGKKLDLLKKSEHTSGLIHIAHYTAIFSKPL